MNDEMFKARVEQLTETFLEHEATWNDFVEACTRYSHDFDDTPSDYVLAISTYDSPREVIDRCIHWAEALAETDIFWEEIHEALPTEWALPKDPIWRELNDR